MRKLLITTLLALVGMLPVWAMNEEGHVLKDLWKKYEAAHKEDRPQKEAEILADIRQQAQKQHLPVDFYDAATEYVYTVQRRDWKKSDELREELKSEVERFNDPVVTFLWMREWKRASSDALWAYVQSHAKEFKGNHPALHRGVDNFLNGALKPFIRSDREFALWALLQNRSYVDVAQDEIYQALKAELNGSYPGDGALEFYVLGRKYNSRIDRPKKKEALQAFQNQYFGKALALFAEANLMVIQKEELDEAKADETKYKALDIACQRFEARRKTFVGEEATLANACTVVARLMEGLEREELGIRIDSARVLVLFKNLYHANLTVREDNKTVKTWKVANLDRSFYVQDTVSVDLPKLPDGTYTIEAVSGKHIANSLYNQYTLSLAIRQDASGPSVYVADYKTGEPLSTVSLSMRQGDKEVANSTLRMKGFTPLPEAFIRQMEENKRMGYNIRAMSGERRSQTLSMNFYSGSGSVNTRPRCNIYLDRGAYNPGDTVKFKVIAYEGNPSEALKVCKGMALEVSMEDTENNKLNQVRLLTNDWGSASGEFVIPTGLRGGLFELQVKGLASTYFRVDEFVLPTFDLSFNPDNSLYLPGSEVPVSGTVRSYSGHSLAGARVSLWVEHYGEVVKEDEQALDASGEFYFKFLAQTSGPYHASVKVTDGTGETLEFTNYWFISHDLHVYFDVLNAVKGEAGNKEVVTTRQLNVKLEALSSNFHPVVMPVSYKLLKADGTQLLEGTVPSGEALKLDLPGSGLYTLEAAVSATQTDGTIIEEEDDIDILCLLPEDKRLPSWVNNLFLPGNTELKESESIEARIGTGQGRVYAVATLFGDKRNVLMSKQFVVEDGRVDKLQVPYLDSYPDVVRLIVFYFIDGEQVRYDWLYRRVKDKFTLPLSFTRFQDKAYPGTLYTFAIKTDPGVEALVSAWDKSLETICPLNWNLVSMRSQAAEYIPFRATCGVVGFGYVEDRMVAMSAKTKSANVLSDAIDIPDVEMEGEALEEAVFGFRGLAIDEGIAPRMDFSSALTFQPHLRPSADGTLEFSFRTSDKLSTYIVRVYAHDKAMHNALCEKEMVVSLPVKVSLQEPRCLYAGDVYEAAVTVSSMADEPVSGVIKLKAGESVQQIPVTVKPGSTETKRFPVKPGMTEGSLVLTASFIASEFSDAVQVSVPVYPAAQVLTEAHSAVLRDGMDRETLLEELRSRFVNVPAAQAALKDISVLDMVKDAIPSHVDPSGDDVLSLSEAYYIRLLASKLNCHSERSEESVSDSSLLDKILACQNTDGGFAWFPGMKSSAIITAVLLERFALLRDRGFEVPDMDEAVYFLDAKQFGTVFPVWNGWVSDAQYMRVRALYADVPFEVKPVSAQDKKRMADFKKAAKDYLTPSKKDGRGLEGQILSKARRLLTLRSLSASSEGQALAKAWGIGLSSRLKKSMKADVNSLLEYAVEHRDGGWYYPNAVMPFRGLLESEAYAHALLCQLLQADGPVIADGIRLWLMLQKETQKWDTEPAFIDAITAILDGSEAVLNTRVLALSATYEAPFSEIKASGNGFTVERKFFRAIAQERLYDDKTGPNDQMLQWVAIEPGEKVSVGDKIKVVYSIWNAENRSFVKLTAGREASLRPVEQLSGYLGGGFLRPLHSGISWGFTPFGYRNVKASATEYYFDSYPEENTQLSEEFFVTQAGTFVAPVTVIESLYAPHYRANSAFRPALTSLAQ